MKAKERTSILGLSFEGKMLTVCQMRRRGGRLVIDKSLKAPLVLDPLSAEAVLVGREIRNQLDGAGIRERNCAVCLPLSWMLTLHTELPDLAGEDLESFLAMQAERSLPFAPEDLIIGESRVKPAEGPGLATLVAISRNSLASLQAVLKAAGLRPVLFTPGVATLTLPASAAVLLAHDGGLDLAVYHGGGFALIRSLDEALDNGPEGSEWDHELIARQMRISLGCLPPPIREAIRTVLVFGGTEQVADLTAELKAPLAAMGLTIGSMQADLAARGLDPARWSQAASVGACCLGGAGAGFNLLPPHVGRFRQLAGRLSGRGALVLGGGAAVLIVLTVALMTIQATRLGGMEKEWTGMKSRVKKIEDTRTNIRKYRPWFNNNAESLAIATAVTSAFPAEGSVWVKSLLVKDLSQITCSGSSRSEANLQRLREELTRANGITELHSPIVKGQQFTLNFRWEGVRGNGE